MINIIFSDFNRGGVFTVSNSLVNALNSQGVKAFSYNIREDELSFSVSCLKTIKYFMSKSSRKDDFILMHFDSFFIGLLLNLLGFNKIVNVVHTDVVEYYKSISFSKKIVVRFLFHLIRNSKVVFVSFEAEKKAASFFNLSNTQTIYNIYEPPAGDVVKHPVKDLKLGVLSRLNKSKNIDLIIRLTKELRRYYPRLKVYIYGEGVEKDELNRYVKELGCNDCVFIKGFISDIEYAFSSFDALVSMSSIEGLPTVILESVSFKTPVFHTDCSSGPRELMAPDTDPLAKTASYEKTNIGYLVKPTKNTATYSQQLDDYETEYVDIMLAFIDDLKNSRFSMEYDPDRFSEKTIVKQWQELIVMSN